MTRHFFKIALGSALALAAAQMPAGAQGASDAKLTVWWVKGFYKSEDDRRSANSRRRPASRSTCRNTPSRT
jgi:hypothetical protein